MLVLIRKPEKLESDLSGGYVSRSGVRDTHSGGSEGGIPMLLYPGISTSGLSTLRVDLNSIQLTLSGNAVTEGDGVSPSGCRKPITSV